MKNQVLPWHGFLCELQKAGDFITIGAAVDAVGVSLPKSKIKEFYDIYPCLADVLEDYIPTAEVLLALATRNLGQEIEPDNLEKIREEVETIADAKAYRCRELILEDLGRRFPSTSLVDAKLVQAIIEEYEPAVTSLNNSGIVIAGRVHELILQASLSSVALESGKDFGKPKKPRQNGDIRVTSRSTGDHLATEVKSLKARERFKRGLGEIKGDKVGAGFFDEASEFTEAATTDLVDLAWSVYLPINTLQALPEPIRSRTNKGGRVFYRPVSRYAKDMQRFVLAGEFP